MRASIAQLVEHRSRKAGVTSSSLVAGSIELKRVEGGCLRPVLFSSESTGSITEEAKWARSDLLSRRYEGD